MKYFLVLSVLSTFLLTNTLGAFGVDYSEADEGHLKFIECQKKEAQVLKDIPEEYDVEDRKDYFQGSESFGLDTDYGMLADCYQTAAQALEEKVEELKMNTDPKLAPVLNQYRADLQEARDKKNLYNKKSGQRMPNVSLDEPGPFTED